MRRAPSPPEWRLDSERRGGHTIDEVIASQSAYDASSERHAPPRALTVGVVSPSGTRGLVGCCAAEVWASTRRCRSGGKGAEGGPPPPAHAPCARRERPPSDLQWGRAFRASSPRNSPTPFAARPGWGCSSPCGYACASAPWATFRRSLPRNARLRRNRARPPDPPIPLAHLGERPGDCRTDRYPLCARPKRHRRT